MKTREKSKKLTLNKMAITRLNGLEYIRGGNQTGTTTIPTIKSARIGARNAKPPTPPPPPPPPPGNEETQILD